MWSIILIADIFHDAIGIYENFVKNRIDKQFFLCYSKKHYVTNHRKGGRRNDKFS